MKATYIFMGASLMAALTLVMINPGIMTKYKVQNEKELNSSPPSKTSHSVEKLELKPNLASSGLIEASVSKAQNPFNEETQLNKIKTAVLEAGNHIDLEARRRVYQAAGLTSEVYDQGAEQTILEPYESPPLTTTAKKKLLAIYHLIFSAALDSPEVCERLILSLATQSKTASHITSKKALLFDADKIGQHCGHTNQEAFAKVVSILEGSPIARQVRQYLH